MNAEASSPAKAPAGLAPDEAAPWSWARAKASDADRERTVALLREHWLAGRLTIEELEQRAGEAYGARAIAELWRAVRGLPVTVARRPSQPTATTPSPSAGRGVDSFVTGVAGLCLLLGSMGLLWVLSLPFSLCGWVLGRQARRRMAAGGYVRHASLATAGEVIGVIGTVLGAALLAGCAAFVARF